MQHVVITGVSTGIGQGTARVLAQKGMHVFGSVRRQEDATPLMIELGAQFTPLFFDVTDEVAVATAAKSVQAHLQGELLSGLINNAGIAVPGPLLHFPLDDYRHQMNVNLTGPLIVTQAFAPLLGASADAVGNPGRIIMMSSIAGRLAGPFLGPYHASKFGLEGLADTLRRELMVYGIDVIVVEPGDVVTAIWDKAEQVDDSRYAHTDYAPMLKRYTQTMIVNGRKGLPTERLGEVIYRALTVRHPQARYAVLRRRFFSFTLPQLLPARFVDRMVARSVGLSRKVSHA